MKTVQVEMNARVTMIVKCKDKDVEAAKAKLTDPIALKEQFGVDDLHVTKSKIFIIDHPKKTNKEN